MRIPFIEPYKETPDEDSVFITDSHFPYPTVSIMDEKSKIKFINNVEKTVRTSYEYREYIQYLVNNMGMEVCSVFTNLNKSLARKFKIEIHHEPFTLFDIVSIVLEKHQNERDHIDFLDICEEVIEIHFMGRVGLIPLSVTVHELVHSGHVFIPLQFIDDGFMKFYEQYKPYINEQMQDILKQKIELSRTFNNKSNNVLNKKFIYLNHKDYNNIPEKIQVA